MRATKLVVVTSALVLAAWLATQAAAAAPKPVVSSTVEGRDSATGDPMLVLAGNALTGIKKITLVRTSDAQDMGAVTALVKTGNLFVLRLPVTVAADAANVYTLHVTFKGGSTDVPVTIGRGRPLPLTIDGAMIAAALRTDLDDAATLDGHDAAYFHDSANLSGALPFTVIPFGTGTNQVARGDHAHDERYVQKSGGSMTGALTVDTSGSTALDVTGSANAQTIRGTTTAAGAVGILGACTANGDSDFGVGVRGEVDGGNTVAFGLAAGVHGLAKSTNGIAFGVYGEGNGAQSIGVVGESHGSGGVGVVGAVSGASAYAMLAQTSNGTFLICQNDSGIPYARIDKTGKGFFNGGTATSGADFAESVKVDRPLAEFEPGDVMAIDPSGARRFKLSGAADSALVCGVYSTKPGVLGRPGDVSGARDWESVEVPLAVVGIVPTKVCDEGGAIRAGDLLVAASVAGHAKRAGADPKPGTVIGKALDVLAQGRGKIEVLLMAR